MNDAKTRLGRVSALRGQAVAPGASAGSAGPCPPLPFSGNRATGGISRDLVQLRGQVTWHRFHSFLKWDFFKAFLKNS